ncbi:MAG: hypothetical protein WB347_09945 [Terriglobales bacterium]
MYATAVLVISDRFASPDLCEFAHGARVPTGCVEILGQSVLEQTVARLRRAGVQAISVIAGANPVPVLPGPDLEIAIAGRSVDRWSKATRTLQEHAAQGAEEVLVIGLGAYTECDVAEALQFHRTKRNFLTQLQHSQQPLDFWIVNAAAIRLSACDCTLPFTVDRTLGPYASYQVKGYVNQLADARDLRRLAVDVFLARCTIRPRGQEVRPGIWMDDGAKPHRSARIVAPAYLGRCAKLGPAAVVARFSNVERNCHVGGGTVIDSASILAYTSIGRGLDVSHALVDGSEFVDLNRDLAVRIDDPNLIRSTAPRPWGVSQDQRERGEPLDTRIAQIEPEYAQHLSRAAVRLSVFKGEV